MKKSIIILVILGVGIASAVIFFGRQKVVPVSAAPIAQTQESQPIKKIQSQTIASQPPMISADTNTPIATPAVETSTVHISKTHQMVDTLLAAKSSDEKHEMFKKLAQRGELDDAIAELKQRAADNPNDAEIPTTLGEAQLNELRAMRDAGNNDYSAIGILAMQADQSFNAALKIDPQNWEAQFVKNSSMYYWPANPEMDNQVVQNLSNLIDQQETMPSDPDFAQTYLVLGNEYQKIGQPDKAQATWQLGLTKFPNDSTLQKKISGQ